MKNILNILWISILIPVFSQAQIIYGKNNFTAYQRGRLPIIISIPHGGNIAPANIPDRTCNNPTTVTDANTIELGRQIDSSLFNLTGCHAHLILCHLKRTKLDCNRNLDDGACSNIEAENAWMEFHKFIDTAEFLAQQEYQGKALFIDLHGHGHAIQQLELGYSLTAKQLDQPDSLLNSTSYINSSSIRNLVSKNINGFNHAELIRGQYALGTILTNAGYPSVPSLTTPTPGSNPYFDGGYNTQNYTSNLAGNTVDGLQIECNYTNVRENYTTRKVFGEALAKSILSYLEIHQNLILTQCSLVNSTLTKEGNPYYLYTNTTNQSMYFQFHNLNLIGKQYLLHNYLGAEIRRGIINTENQIQINHPLSSGIYFISIYDMRFTAPIKIFVK
ncbi:MAG: hypothetical protein IPG55_11015 [Saprospiraceae bacterium]|nr:hypothetical protein [Candidatus Defluviibacterium haderslevense]MBK7244100.1 hypothetical protein [Candidatus Defluviibacterium haderslevense]